MQVGYRTPHSQVTYYNIGVYYGRELCCALEVQQSVVIAKYLSPDAIFSLKVYMQ